MPRPTFRHGKLFFVRKTTARTHFSLLEGEFFGADPITEGSLTLLVVDPPAQGKAGCFAGTFNLKSQSGGITTFDYTNGRFVYYRGTVSQSDFGNAENTGCNPFN